MVGTNEDITLQVRAEEQLRQRERDLQSVLDNLPSMIGYWDRNLRNRFGNHAYYTWFGIDPDRMPGMHIRDVIGEERYRLNLPYMERALRGEPQLFERAIPSPEGEGMRHTVAHYIPDIQNSDVRGFYVLISDITPLKEAENALRESEARFRILFQNSSEAQLVIEEGRFVDCNTAALSMMGLSDLKWIMGKSPEAISPEYQPDGRRSAERLAEMITEVHETGSLDVEWLIVRANGEQFLADVLLTTIQIAGQRMIHAALRDITARKRIEEIQARLAAIVESSDDAIIGYTLDGIINSWNPGAERLFGYEASEIVGRHMSVLRAPDHEHEESELLPRIAQGERISHFETARIRKDGSPIDVSVSLSPIRDQNGQIVGASKIARDITERKRLDKELSQAKEEAETATRVKSQFLANMSHEIRTPMNAIIGLTQMALETELTPKQHDYLNKIRMSSKALLYIINDILDFSKIEAGKLLIQPQDFNLEESLRNVSSLFLPTIEEKGLELFIEIVAEVPLALVGDSLRLEQVLGNLIGNAVKFTEKGEIHVRVEAAERDEDEAVLRFSVRDTGIGLSREQIDRLFQPFAQADGSITRRYGGTGLGLTISRYLVELMGGALTVSSEPGQGSVFEFTVRLGVAREQPELPPKHYLEGLRSLVVDDQETALMILCGLLGCWDGQVSTMAQGEGVLERLEQAEADGQPFELVFLDWKMPGLSGLDVAAHIEDAVKAGRLKRPPTVIMVTAYSKDRVLQDERAAHVDDILIKPVTRCGLLNAIMRIRHPSSEQAAGTPKPVMSPYEMVKRIRGARILLVEDNKLNQEVAREFLEKAGFIVTVACHGREGVDLVRKDRFDAVLMDLQMPVMDGLQATRLIRGLSQGEAIPIIAMTAAAMPSDRQACTGAGMNDFIAKPLDPRELFSTLLKWIKPGGKDEMPGEIEPQAVQERSFPPIPGIDADQVSHRLMGNLNLFNSLLRGLADQYADTAILIRTDLTEGRREDAARRAHTLRGSAGTVSANELATVSMRVETAIQEEKETDLQESLALLEEMTDRLVSHIRTYLSGISTGETGRREAAKLDNGALAELLAKLEARNIKAMDDFSELRLALEARYGENSVERLGAAIEGLRFAEAASLLKETTRNG